MKLFVFISLTLRNLFSETVTVHVISLGHLVKMKIGCCWK